jgi:hypothetical protein
MRALVLFAVCLLAPLGCGRSFAPDGRNDAGCGSPCAAQTDCASAEYCVFDKPSGCAHCASSCSGTSCPGSNTCATDADCPANAHCVCSLVGCTVCAFPL